MLLLVCYSCIFNVIVVTFQTDSFDSFDIPNRCIEAFFYFDLILNFFQAYKNPETFQEVQNFKLIAYKYL